MHKINSNELPDYIFHQIESLSLETINCCCEIVKGSPYQHQVFFITALHLLYALFPKGNEEFIQSVANTTELLIKNWIHNWEKETESREEEND